MADQMIFRSTTYTKTAIRHQVSQELITPEKTDVLIKESIEKLTSENSTIWTSPDHSRREYVHSFFQYPAMMVPIVQKRIIDIIKQAKPETQKVIDPFMGSATSLVACIKLCKKLATFDSMILSRRSEKHTWMFGK